jgi:hypothetical protein
MRALSGSNKSWADQDRKGIIRTAILKKTDSKQQSIKNRKIKNFNPAGF